MPLHLRKIPSEQISLHPDLPAPAARADDLRVRDNPALPPCVVTVPAGPEIHRHAAPRVRITRLPRDPDGARSLGTSTYVSTPSNGTRFGWSRTSGIVTAIASSFIRSPRFPD